MSQDKKTAKPPKSAKPKAAEPAAKKVSGLDENKSEVAQEPIVKADTQAGLQIPEPDENKAAGSEVVQASALEAETPSEPETREPDENKTPGSEIVQEQAPAEESEVQADAQESEAPEWEAEVETVPEDSPEPDQEKISGQDGSGLKPARTWISGQRLASWQSAALLRAMGWTDDKQVSEAEFNRALKAVLARPQGGSRRGGKKQWAM